MPIDSDCRPDPNLLLRGLDSADDQLQHERLKVFLGYASGVGKSFRMLDEGRRRRERGQDVVIGAIQPDLPPDSNICFRPSKLFPSKKWVTARPWMWKRFCAGIRKSAWWMALLTTILPAARTPSAGRMWKNCWRRESWSLPPSTFSTLRSAARRWSGLPASVSPKPSPSVSYTMPTKSSSWTSRRNSFWSAPGSPPNGAGASGAAPAAFRFARDRLAAGRRGG